MTSLPPADPPPPTLTARPGTTFRERYPRLMAQPSPRAQPIMTQAGLRFEEPPVGRTARQIRAEGFVVPANVPDDAVLMTEAEYIAEGACEGDVGVASVGRRTGYVMTHDIRTLAAWLRERPEMLLVMTPEELASESERALASVRLSLSLSDIASMHAGALVAYEVEREAARREALLETAERFSLAP